MASRRLLGRILFFLLCAGGAAATRAPAQEVPAPAADLLSRVDLQADRIEYRGQDLVLTDHVVIGYQGAVLRADYAQVNTVTEDAYAKGGVTLTRPDGTVWQGDELVYNLRTGAADFGSFTLTAPPFYVYSEHAERTEPQVVRLRRVTVTPCEGDAPEIRMTARRATVTDERYVRARHAVFFLGKVPIFYTPWYRKDLKGDGRWDFLPGYSSRMGPFLLTAYNYPLGATRAVKGVTTLHTYGRRGVGFGQGLTWRDPERAWRGSAQGFVIDDRKPFRDDAEEQRRGAYLEDSGRYRLRLAHSHDLGPRDTLLTDATYLSDPYVQRDFFRDEYRLAPQPDNRVTLTRRADRFTASLQFNKRLNDFYENVDRLPEARIDVPQVPVPNTPLYYESGSGLARLERVFPRDSAGDDYGSTRFDTWHEITYPRQYFGFLSLTPRGRLRGTYYSDTLADAVTVTNFVTSVDTNTGLTAISPQVVTTQADAGSDLRQVAEFGVFAFFKAFKVLDPGDTQWGSGLRHVVEPYAEYTFRPEPNLRPANLYRFDDVDRLDLQHDVRLGLRNKLQSRKDRTRVYDIVDADVYTTYRIETIDGEPDTGPLVADVELRPAPWFAMDFDARYDTENSTLTTFNSQLAFVASDRTSLAVEYRYRDGQRSLVTAEMTLFPGRAWSFGTYHRYEFETSQLEEQSYYVQHRMDCIGWTLGLRHEPAYESGEKDDFGVWLQLWILNMPGSSLQLGG